jgi:nucleotide-binding universal stress UspA family protein
VAGREEQPQERRQLVPLDGSPLAEKALPLAERLATEWDASLWLLHVVTDPGKSGVQIMGEREAAAYLEQVARRLTAEVQIEVRAGRAVEGVITTVRTLGITDIVMTTHGRTGLSRVLVGTVADELIHRLRCPIVVIPALAALES